MKVEKSEQEGKDQVSRKVPKENGLSIKIRWAFAFLFLLLGAFWLFVCFKHSGVRLTHRIVGAAGVFYISIALLLFFLKIRSKVVIHILTFLTVLNFGYLSIEAFMYCYTCFSKTSYQRKMFNRPCAKFDSIRGYRWVGDSARVARVIKGKVIYDQRFHINKQGWISSKDYTFKKSSSNMIRYIVFGDSFTTAFFLEAPWPEQIEKILNSNEQPAYEFYSFAVDGGGLANWHKVFFEEIIPDYEFDGVIFAGFVDNLYRNFAIFHMTEKGGGYKTFPTMPKDVNDFELNYFDKIRCYWSIADDAEMDNFINPFIKSACIFRLYPIDSYIVHSFILWHDGIVMRKESEKRIRNSKSLFEEKIKKLEHIVKWCQDYNKQTILVTIPSRPGLLKREKTEHQMEYETIAKRFNMLYYDGYKVFNGLSPKGIKRHWLVYDGHWNLQGSDRFARHFARYIQENSSGIR